VEGFLNIDPETQLAQRQMGQMEGERRYNDLGRLQNPFTTIPGDKMDAGITQVVPTPSSSTGDSSLLSLLGFTKHGGLDDGSNKTGAGTEQTGMVASKINFCEGITNIDCGLLDDPRLAECGFCHRDGKNSKGKAHRGGMFISSDDQVRANERAGKRLASYQPTVGTCKPEYFTLVNQRCSNLEQNLVCQRAGAATDSNECGQCFGSAKPGTTGLLYMGPKPATYQALLNISHTGSHLLSSDNGLVGMTITLNGTLLPPISSAQNPVLYNTQIPINIKEGDQLVITLYGAPPVWCAWLSNQGTPISPAGTRTIGLNLGETGMAPQGGYVIAGDSNSKTVAKYMNMFAADAWANYKPSVPPNVLWYERREIISPAVTTAWYGNNYTDVRADVTTNVKQAATGNQDFVANAGDTGANYLYINNDIGGNIVFPSGSMVPVADVQNIIQMSFTVPATLADPHHDIDRQECQTGPIVTTSVGSGLMGANSCYSADGSFNPSLSCIRQLFIGAGGTPQGKSYPQTEADAKTWDKGSLDATVDYLNDLYNKASYGTDLDGAPVTDFAVVQNASMQLFGYSLNNPCEGPTQQSGPHSELCLDYLWRTSGNPGQDAQPTDLSKLPYNYCSKDGLGAPIRSDGTVNYEILNTANEELRTIPNIRNYFQLIHDTMSSSNFNDQRWAMRQCMNVSVTEPPPSTDDCPATNPDEWQCFGPSKLAGDEVFYVAPGGTYSVAQADAEGVCASFGARLATDKELVKAQRAGADWCSTGWLLDSPDAKYPRNSNLPPGQWGCGSPGINIYTPGTAGVNCYGKRPTQGNPDVYAFNAQSWSNPLFSLDNIQISLMPVLAYGHYLEHQNFVFYSQQYNGTPQMQQDGTLRIVDPNNGRDGYVSFQSINYPTQYLRHANFSAFLNANDGSWSYNDDSSFKIIPALNGDPNAISLQASNDSFTINGSTVPGYNYYIALDHAGSPANIILADQSTINPSQASWYRVPALNLNSPISATAVPLCKNNNGTIICQTSDPTGVGKDINYSINEQNCNNWLNKVNAMEGDTSAYFANWVPAPQGLADLISTYLTNRS